MEIEPEWLNEVDELFWMDEKTGLPCFIRRHSELLHLCGYVGCEDKLEYLNKIYEALDVHGGITFGPQPGLYGTPKTAVDVNRYNWVGFDCAHLGDLNPSLHDMREKGLLPQRKSIFGYDETYKNIAFVKEQCEYLAKQLKWHKR